MSLKPRKKQRCDENLYALTLLRENKAFLWGSAARSGDVSLADRAERWQEIFDKCKAAGISWASGNDLNGKVKDGAWLTSKYYQLKRTLTDKIDRSSRKSETGGGIDARLTESDRVILDILGYDSPAVISVDVADSGGAADAESEVDCQQQHLERFINVKQQDIENDECTASPSDLHEPSEKRWMEEPFDCETPALRGVTAAAVSKRAALTSLSPLPQSDTAPTWSVSKRASLTPLPQSTWSTTRQRRKRPSPYLRSESPTPSYERSDDRRPEALPQPTSTDTVPTWSTTRQRRKRPSSYLRSESSTPSYACSDDRRPEARNFTSRMQTLRMRNEEMSNDLLAVQNYEVQLRCMKLEKELGLPHRWFDEDVTFR